MKQAIFFALSVLSLLPITAHATPRNSAKTEERGQRREAKRALRHELAALAKQKNPSNLQPQLTLPEIKKIRGYLPHNINTYLTYLADQANKAGN